MVNPVLIITGSSIVANDIPEKRQILAGRGTVAIAFIIPVFMGRTNRSISSVLLEAQYPTIVSGLIMSSSDEKDKPVICN